MGRRRPGVGAAALVSALLVACSDGDKAPGEPAGQAPATATATASTTAPAAPAGTSTATTVTTLANPGGPAKDPPATAAEVAGRIIESESAIRDPATPPTEAARRGRDQQVAYRTLMLHPEWDSEVRSLLPPPLRPVAEANVAAGRDLRALTPPPRDGRLPKWQIVAPEPPDVLLAHYKEATAATGVPWQYLAAVHLVETRMGRIRGDSSAGAQGPMQFLPSTWKIYGNGGDIQSTRDSIHAAARLLRRNGAPTNMAAALMAYNHSARYVRAVTAYAEQMRAGERAFLGYYGWQVFYGDRLLPEGTDLR